MLREFETTEVVKEPRVYTSVQAINKARNYIRYKVIRGWNVDLSHPLITPQEKVLLEQMNKSLDLIREEKSKLTGLRIRFYVSFYSNCPIVGSTLKKVVKRRLINLPFYPK